MNASCDGKLDSASRDVGKASLEKSIGIKLASDDATESIAFLDLTNVYPAPLL